MIFSKAGYSLAPACRRQRQWLLVLLLLIGFIPAVRVPAASCLPPPSGLTGWWPGDGNADDIQGVNHGSLQGGATATGTGLVQSAFSLDGTNGYVQIPDAPDLRPANLTIEGWVRFNSLDSPGSGPPAGQTYIVFKRNTRTNNFEGFNVYKTRVSSRDYLVFGVSSASGTVAEVQSTTQVAINTWYHFAGARGSNFIQIFVNGSLEGQNTNVGFAQDYGSYPLYLGASGQSYFDRKLNGSLDEVSLYNRALSPGEIAAIYNAGAAGKCKGLTITTQPQSRTAVAGTNVTFTVAAIGGPPLGYQWQFNGAALADATNTSFSRTDVQPASEGNYTVIVTNPISSVTSEVAVLTVLVPPAITAQPQSSTNAPGGSAGFSATATGTAPLALRWRHNGVALTNGARINGATTDTLQISNIQPADAGDYVLVATNAAGAAASAPAVLAVSGPPFILTQPASQSAAAGAGAGFAVTATGTTPLSYQWQHNGAPLGNGGGVSGATNDTLLLTNVQTNNAGNYQVVITNSEGAVTSQVAVLTVNQPPFITAQPASQAVAAGTNVLFTVVAFGVEPLSYQWRFNGTNLANGGQVSGATSSALAIAPVLSGHAGSYSVVVTNFLGSTTSTVAILTVTPPTDCSSAPAGLVGWWPGDGSTKDIIGGNNGTLQGNAIANTPGFNGQAFRFDGTNDYVQIPDSPVFHLTNLTVECWVRFAAYQTPGNTAYPNQQYIVFKQNSKPYEFEGFALTKDHDPQGDVFLWEVASPTAKLIRIDSVSTVVTGVWYHVVGVRGPDYVKLYKDGQLEAQTNVNFPQDYGTLPLYFGSSGQPYNDRKMQGDLDEVSLYNRALSASEIAALYAAGAAGKCKGTNGILITAQPQSQSVLSGSNVSFSVAATASSSILYQWQFNGVPITGATSSTLAFASAGSTNAGSYKVVLTNPTGTKSSADAFLTVTVPPSVTLQPTNQTVLAGATVYFSAAASGTVPMSYQWRFNGTNLDGAVGQTLSLTNVQPAQAGDYTVAAGNGGGSATSEVAVLSVLVPPSIALQPTNQTVPVGATVNFNAAASGTMPMSYQWRFNGTNLDGAVTETLSLINVNLAQAGGYSVLVTNSAGSITSAVAVVTVAGPPLLLNARTTAGGAFAFTLSGTAGLAYLIETTTNFQQWAPLVSLTNTAPETDFIDASSSNGVARAYRARLAY